MNKITEAKNTIDEMEYLIKKMKFRIEFLHSVLHCYVKQFGNEVEYNPMPEDVFIDFYSSVRNDKIWCEVIDYKKSGVTPDRKFIMDIIKSLEQK